MRSTQRGRSAMVGRNAPGLGRRACTGGCAGDCAGAGCAGVGVVNASGGSRSSLSPNKARLIVVMRLPWLSEWMPGEREPGITSVTLLTLPGATSEVCYYSIRSSLRLRGLTARSRP